MTIAIIGSNKIDIDESMAAESPETIRQRLLTAYPKSNAQTSTRRPQTVSALSNFVRSRDARDKPGTAFYLTTLARENQQCTAWKSI